MSTSTEDRVRSAVRAAFRRVAPEVDFDGIDPRDDIREQVDLDSVDVLNLMVELDEELGVEVPETDYDEISTLDGMVRYLVTRMEEGL